MCVSGPKNFWGCWSPATFGLVVADPAEISRATVPHLAVLGQMARG